MTRELTTSLDPDLGGTIRPVGVAVARPGPLDTETRRRRGRNLRLLYAPVLAEPVPQRFADLLAALSAPVEEDPSR